MAAAEAARQELEKIGGGVEYGYGWGYGHGWWQWGQVTTDFAGVALANVDADFPAYLVRKPIVPPAVATGDAVHIPIIRSKLAQSSQGELPVMRPDGQVVPMSEATPAMRA
jgi:hypothetical protein